MANRDNGTKFRLLFLERYMLDHTDDQRSVTTEELIQLCQDHGFKANRDTIRDDMAALGTAGIDIISERVGHSKTYHVGARLFEVAELRALVDAVSSSRFISRTRSDILIDKLSKLTSVENRGYLSEQLFAIGYQKSDNPTVFITTDKICTAKATGKKIAFHYWNYNPDKEKVLRNGGEIYIASPYALVWNDDRYYLVAFSDKRQKVVPFRIDRMCDVDILDEPAMVDGAFNPSEYSKSALRMFDGDVEEADVTLACDNPHMQSVIDRFGENVETKVLDAKTFQATVRVRPSKTFYSWVFQFLGEIRIIGPKEIREEYEQLLLDILSKQKGGKP